MIEMKAIARGERVCCWRCMNAFRVRKMMVRKMMELISYLLHKKVIS